MPQLRSGRVHCRFSVSHVLAPHTGVVRRVPKDGGANDHHRSGSCFGRGLPRRALRVQGPHQVVPILRGDNHHAR